MTLVPEEESGNTSVKSLDDRRVYELIPGGIGGTTTDFEGRTLVRGTNSLKISGKAAQVTVRWRFGKASSVTVNGRSVEVRNGADGPYVEFRHTGESTIAWK